MSISSIKSETLLPDKELIIGRNFEIKGQKMLIASLTEQDDNIKLWVFMKCNNPPYEEPLEIDHMTNREVISKRISRNTVQPSISVITINGITLNISSSSSGCFGFFPVIFMKLQHFIEAGLDTSFIEDIPFEELALCEYNLQEGTVFPEIININDAPVTIIMSEQFHETLITPVIRFSLNIGRNVTDELYSFYDHNDKCTYQFYINELTRHDFAEEMELRFKDEAVLKAWKESGLDDAAINQMKENVHEASKYTCPEGHDQLLVQYEVPDNIQLNFYTTQFLNNTPNKNEGSSTFIMLHRTGDIESHHGGHVRICMFKPIPKDFSGQVEFELISWYRLIPKEKYEV